MEHPMTLHESPEFSEILLATAQQMGLPEAFIEKDYWVTYVLRALADSPYREQLVFKGGTALSKAYGLVKRFSEDVDLAIAGTEGWTGGQVKKLMDAGAKHITQGLMAVVEPGVTIRGSHFRKTLHQFPMTVSALPGGQVRPGAVLLEVNAFARPHPSQWRPVQSYAGQFLTQRGELELVAQYGLVPFEVLVLALERTLVEKILALVRAGYAPDPLTELQAKIRHAYDLHQLLQQPAQQAFLVGAAFETLLAEVRADDARNQEFQGDWATQPLAEARLFSDGGSTWQQLVPTYQGAFRQLVYGGLPPTGDIQRTLGQVGARLRDF
ncbi:nucleotidyl transferase AbiEii/AbiGii toxin family protein [Hymenobacter sp. BRD67]|uniref:nucleotidyl transferase AbiEii/AbiGii toxin family protein n=1 Tax=Hymenobacter sp. BRD67 TaxID=2675877 RepID=UPI0015638B90|nr:nucleotidyl transferase AbiEii/AbiGii toxin family protein [Hymenobacter sp. BRD67]QKG55020.1 nucleotidyl transferase AbiEii/AbiGii toxin family protein [Hymenobacter sp. BRD67]